MQLNALIIEGKLLGTNREVEQDHRQKWIAERKAWELYKQNVDTPNKRRYLREWNIASRLLRLSRGEWPAEIPVDRFPDIFRG